MRMWLPPPDRRGRGFTAVELVVSTLIMCMLGAIFARVMGRLRQSAQPTLSDRLVINIETTRASGLLMDRIRESLEVVRPTLGETTPFLVLRNALNEMNLLFLEPDEANSALCKKTLYRLKSYTRDGTPGGTTEQLFDSVQRLTFTCTSPNQVQFSLVLGNLKGEFGLVTQVGMMSFGELE
ncbi:MAG: hypothetical protein GX442_20245 [Candidatus Riflebacteria bacterium]|nr:hypothetical protein [Candidatus Riflebacteria bacterium]